MSRSEEKRQKYSKYLKSWAHMYRYGSFYWSNNSPSVEDSDEMNDDSEATEGTSSDEHAWEEETGESESEYRRRHCAVHQRLIRRYRRRPWAQLGMFRSSSILAFDPRAFTGEQK